MRAALPEPAGKRLEATIERAFSEALGRVPERPANLERSIHVRVCLVCEEQLTSDMLLAQAEQLMEPFRDAPLDGELGDQVGDLLTRAATPFNAGFDCCYCCAYALSAEALNRIQ